MEQRNILSSTNTASKPIGRKNKGGRPKVAIKKDQMIPVKCSSMEKKVIRTKAKTAGFTASEYLRKLGLDQKIDRTEKALPVPVQEHLAGFRHTGSNLNQIARRLNSGEKPSNLLLAELHYHLEELKKIEDKLKTFFE